jgi:hypothetical protein
MSDIVGELDSIVLTLQHLELDVERLMNGVINLRMKNTVGTDTPLSSLHPDLQDLYFEHSDVGGLDN